MPYNALLAGALQAGLNKGVESLVSKFIESNKLQDAFAEQDLIRAVSPHLESTYERCKFVKTILRDKREDFIDVYSKQGFLIDGDRVDQDWLVNFIKDGNTTVLQGTGGGGKSMFVRYLWLSYFALYDDKLPIFIELRSLNSSKHENFEDFLYHTIISKTKFLNQISFSREMEKGNFILFLDGFDEIEHTSKPKFQRAIISLKEKYPNLTILLTSREDERFFGWHQFQTVKVAPLTKNECIDVLNKAPFDAQEREKLIAEVRKSLWDTHESFLSNPLLSYMTLVTYSYNPDFSDRMFEFYEQAFEALYYRHDLTKGGGYIRKFHTGYTKKKFQRILAYFCLRTYFDEKFEFSTNTLQKYIEEAKRISTREFASMNSDDFIQDIMENVCLLKKEGLYFAFTHRKLQEYFAAFCIARVANRKLDRLFERFARRYSDDVLGMVYDLSPDLFRKEYIIPFYKKNKKFFKLKTEKAII